MSKTASDLSKEILRELTLLNGNDEPEAVDDAYVKSVSDSEHETLPTMGVNISWVSTDIPDSVFRPLAKYLATQAGPRYGQTFDPNEVELRLRKLRAACKFSYVGATVKALYY